MFFPYDKKYDRVLETRYSKWRQNVTNGERDLGTYAAALSGYFNGNQKDIYDHVILYEDISKDPGFAYGFLQSAGTLQLLCFSQMVPSQRYSTPCQSHWSTFH